MGPAIFRAVGFLYVRTLLHLHIRRGCRRPVRTDHPRRLGGPVQYRAKPIYRRRSPRRPGQGVDALTVGLRSIVGEGRQVCTHQPRAETAAEKPTFRDAFRKRRCLIPADGFYEWMRQGKAKQPFSFRLNDDKPFAFAGLWERWEGPAGAVETCCILTTAANELVAPAHDRMPVMFERSYFEQWLDPAGQNAEALAWMLRPYRAEAMRGYPVRPLVNSPKNDDARCLEMGLWNGRGFLR
jgi:putative SOS response-associated peptidase YedK